MLGVIEILWLKGLLTELKLDQEVQMKLWCNNKSAISIINNLVQHDRIKYVEINRFFIKKELNNGLLKLSHVATEEQVKET
jgi:hypothetical protein